MGKLRRLAMAIGWALVCLIPGGARAQAPPATDFTPPAANAVCPESPWENLSFFGGIEASKQPQDLGINANFGGNFSANLGLPLLEDYGLGAQVGSGVNLEHAGVRVLSVTEGTTHREQWFTTAGLFQRIAGWHWAVAYDHQMTSYYNAFQVGQMRGEVGYNLTDSDEFGVWGTADLFGYDGRVLNVNVRLDPIAQGALYWRHTWESTAQTRVWAGAAEPHGQDILSIPDRDNTTMVLTFGLEVYVPFNDHVALFGQGNFITPSDTGTLDAYLGIAFYPGGGARRAPTNRFAPVLAVANNPTFALDLARR